MDIIRVDEWNRERPPPAVPDDPPDIGRGAVDRMLGDRYAARLAGYIGIMESWGMPIRDYLPHESPPVLCPKDLRFIDFSTESWFDAYSGRMMVWVRDYDWTPPIWRTSDRPAMSTPSDREFERENGNPDFWMDMDCIVADTDMDGIGTETIRIVTDPRPTPPAYVDVGVPVISAGSVISLFDESVDQGIMPVQAFYRRYMTDECYKWYNVNHGHHQY